MTAHTPETRAALAAWDRAVAAYRLYLEPSTRAGVPWGRYTAYEAVSYWSVDESHRPPCQVAHGR